MIVREVGREDNGKLPELALRIASCRLCPRLVKHREASAADPPRRYRGEEYWARPLPGFGDPRARVLIVGLAPAISRRYLAGYAASSRIQSQDARTTSAPGDYPDHSESIALRPSAWFWVFGKVPHFEPRRQFQPG